jgi:pSer/pThr/pTyr-binding forkhead associated (FHA) protein
VSNKDWRVEGLPRGSALLVVKRGPNAGSRFLLDGPVTSAGRHADSDIVLDGTYVNRELVDSAVLANGDEIQMGKFRLVFLTTRTTA